MIQNLAGMVRHLDPSRVFLSPDFTKAKVVCGEIQTFGCPKMERKHYYNSEELRFATPEVLSKLEEGFDCEDADYDGQVWWDLGVILYLLCSGNRHPFSSGNFRVMMRLIRRYEAAFPKNLPYKVSDSLKSLV